jgi:hypothetical protein
MIIRFLNFLFPGISDKKPKEIVDVEFVFKGDRARKIKELCDKPDTLAANYDLWTAIQTELPNEDFSYGTKWMIRNNDPLTTRIIKYRRT